MAPVGIRARSGIRRITQPPNGREPRVTKCGMCEKDESHERNVSWPVGTHVYDPAHHSAREDASHLLRVPVAEARSALQVEDVCVWNSNDVFPHTAKFQAERCVFHAVRIAFIEPAKPFEDRPPD